MRGRSAGEADSLGMGASRRERCHYLVIISACFALSYLYERLSRVPRVKIYGPPPGASPRGRASLCAFNVDGLHATDVSTMLDLAGVAVRSGHHCTQPLHRYLGIGASARASLYIYNTEQEVDAFIRELEEVIAFFGSV